jgi:Fic family protein
MNKLKMLPPNFNMENIKILKGVNKANKELAELKGLISTIPNSLIIINTLSLREAKDSSEIENIVTTNDELFRADIDIAVENNATKEVKNYNIALKEGYMLVKERGILTTNMIVEIQGILERNKIGIRTQMGTVLKNGKGETVYTP